MQITSAAEQMRAVLDTLFNVYGIPTWRDPLPAVDELISTILSQNTNDVNRDKAFHTLKKRYPEWEQVRDAPEAEFVDCIRVAGLAQQKGPRIKAILNQIYEEIGSFDLSFLANMPVEEARDWLLRFKGVGLKTAAIVLQFSLNKPAFPVDTHIYRVTGRLGVRPDKMDLDHTHRLMESIVDPENYYAGHLNLIRLGREICHARKPGCPICPVRMLCSFPSKTT